MNNRNTQSCVILDAKVIASSIFNTSNIVDYGNFVIGKIMYILYKIEIAYTVLQE